MMPKLNRPVLRYHGGKWKLAPWVISHFPPHRTYVEAFGGAASVLMRKPRSVAEIYNDLDTEIVHVFRVLQDPVSAESLARRITLTPFARDELAGAYEPSTDPVEAAARTVVRSFMGFGSDSITRAYTTGFRSSSKRDRLGSPPPSAEWVRWPWEVRAFVDRLRGVVIENRDAVAVMAQHDSAHTLHYVDPPYVHSTRSLMTDRARGHAGYRFELNDEEHRRLAEFLQTLQGMVVLSGYPSELYAELYPDWISVSTEHLADAGRRRTEVLWLNPAAVVKQRQAVLF